jgi:hypothetical protein
MNIGPGARGLAALLHATPLSALFAPQWLFYRKQKNFLNSCPDVRRVGR